MKTMENYILPITVSILSVSVVGVIVGVVGLLYYYNQSKNLEVDVETIKGQLKSSKTEIRLTKVLLQYKEEELNVVYSKNYKLETSNKDLELRLKNYTTKCENLQLSNFKLQSVNENLNNTIIKLNEVIKKKDAKIDSLKNK